METGKYKHLFKPLKIAEMPGQEQVFKNTGNADVNRWLNGRDHLDSTPAWATGIPEWILTRIPIRNAWSLWASTRTGPNIWEPKFNTAWGRSWKFTLSTGLP